MLPCTGTWAGRGDIEGSIGSGGGIVGVVMKVEEEQGSELEAVSSSVRRSATAPTTARA